MNLKYYKENKVGEEKVLRIDTDDIQNHPTKEGEKVYEVMFVKHAPSEGLSPIILPGLMPEAAFKQDNPFGFKLAEISFREFELYVGKAIEEFWNLVNQGDTEATEETIPNTNGTENKVQMTATVTAHNTDSQSHIN